MAILYYGSVIRIGDTLHLWYNGNFGPPRKTLLEGFELANTVLCHATSRDGFTWVKPNLGDGGFRQGSLETIATSPTEVDVRSVALLRVGVDEVAAPMHLSGDPGHARFEHQRRCEAV